MYGTGNFCSTKRADTSKSWGYREDIHRRKVATVVVHNAALAGRMSELGMTEEALAEEVNTALFNLTGKPGTASDRWVRMLLDGSVRWPWPANRTALEAVFGCSILDLGFVHRGRPPRPAVMSEQPDHLEDTVYRRELILGAGSSALALVIPDFDRLGRLGMSDVDRFAEPLTNLITADDRLGGTSLASIAARQAELITRAVERGKAASRVRSAMYSLAGEFRANAAWFATDDNQLELAQRHLDAALRLAALASDPLLELHAWNSMWHLMCQSGDHTQGLAVAQKGLRSTAARKHPIIAALFHGYVAKGHAHRGEPGYAQRSLGLALKAMDRDPAPAPAPWLAFVDAAELDHQAAHIHYLLGSYVQAEERASRAVAATRPGYTRNRLIRHVRLAATQLGQRDPERALHPAFTALRIAPEVRSGRVDRRLGHLRTLIEPWRNDVPAAADWVTEHDALVAA